MLWRIIKPVKGTEMERGFLFGMKQWEKASLIRWHLSRWDKSIPPVSCWAAYSFLLGHQQTPCRPSWFSCHRPRISGSFLHTSPQTQLKCQTAGSCFLSNCRLGWMKQSRNAEDLILPDELWPVRDRLEDTRQINFLSLFSSDRLFRYMVSLYSLSGVNLCDQASVLTECYRLDCVPQKDRLKS